MDLDYTPWHAQTAIQAYSHGAAGVIFYSTNYYGQDESGEAFYISDWSGPRIDIPVVNTPRNYGEALAELVQQETVTGTIMVDAAIYEESTGYTVFFVHHRLHMKVRTILQSNYLGYITTVMKTVRLLEDNWL